MTEEDGTETDYYTEMDNTPFLSFQEPGKEELSFELVDTRPERLALFLGGNVIEAGGKKTWSKPANAGIIAKEAEQQLRPVQLFPQDALCPKRDQHRGSCHHPLSWHGHHGGKTQQNHLQIPGQAGGRFLCLCGCFSDV